MWNADRLQSLLRTQLRGDQVIVVSNREPYMHERARTANWSCVARERPGHGRGARDAWHAPAPGSHGSGGSDRDAVDSNRPRRAAAGRVRVPLRRLWLTEEQEQGYYYGFANEGLWPLCHVAHVRPVFREQDWEHYRNVNQLFADAVVAEARSEDRDRAGCRTTASPCCPRQLPRATILTFWHILAYPESFGICPWRSEILAGMLGSTILGFHTRFHCKNFIETWTATWRRASSTSTPSSASAARRRWWRATPSPSNGPLEEARTSLLGQCRTELCERLGIPHDHSIGVGVDRFDYTKGILERLNAVERMLEKHPEWRERFTFVQVAAPRAARWRSTAPSRSGSSAPPSASTRAWPT